MKKLIIVCEEKCRQYGDYLAQLISLEDDTEDETVGTKDGEVAAQVWLEKDYKANAAQLSLKRTTKLMPHSFHLTNTFSLSDRINLLKKKAPI